MKRLMLMACTAIAVLFGSQAAFAQTTVINPHKLTRTANSGKHATSNQHEPSQRAVSYPTGPNQNKEYSASILLYAQPFMPKDTKVGVGWMTGKQCDQNGNFTEQGSAMCKIFVSHSAGKTYIFRQSEQEGDRYFVRSASGPELYVHFNGGRYANTIAYQSPAAQQFASASGEKTVAVVASSGAAPATARTVDCKNSNISVGDRIDCASGRVNNGAAATATKPAAPPPVVAQAPEDCSQMIMVARIKCEAQKAVTAAKK